MLKALIVIALAAVSCAPATGAAAPSASRPSRTMFTMPADLDMITFAADRGALIAFSSREGLPPYESKVQRADPATNAWRTVYTSDAHFIGGQVVAGRAALLEYRQPQQGGGAYSMDLTVVDLDSGRAMGIDRFAMTSASYHGGGGGPRGPSWVVALGPDRIAWTRFVEGPGGSITAELATASLAEPSRRQVIGTSTEWIGPLAIDGTRLIYVIGSKTQDELHVRDLASGADRIAGRAAVGDTVVTGPPGIDRAVITGAWAVWSENPPAPTTKGAQQPNATVRVLDLTTGSERAFDAGGSYCSTITAGSRYVAWYCGSSGGPTAELYDAETLQPVAERPPGMGVGPAAADDGLIWFTVIPDGRTVTLYRPR